MPASLAGAVREETGGVRFGPEVDLLLACGSPQCDLVRGRVESLLASRLDWNRLIGLADASGMTPLLLRGASGSALSGKIPAEIREAMRRSAGSSAARSLRLAGELARVMARLEGAGLTPIAFKGPTLAHLAYGDLALRDFTDLDICVPRPQLQDAIELLQADGYAKKTAAWDVRFSGACEIALQRQAAGFEIDLHWRLSPPYFLNLDLARVIDRSVVVRTGGLAARTLCPTDLLLYLCLHAAREGWGLLRFASDIAGLMARARLDWDEVLAEASRNRCRRALAVGVQLAHDLCSAPVPDGVLGAAGRDRAVADVYSQARAAIGSRTPSRGGTPAGARLHLSLMENLGAKARYVWRRVVQPNQLDAEWVRLPRALFAGYYLVRPIRLAWVALSRGGASA